MKVIQQVSIKKDFKLIKMPFSILCKHFLSQRSSDSPRELGPKYHVLKGGFN